LMFISLCMPQISFLEETWRVYKITNYTVVSI
jgi:hypothetical protein